MKISVIIPVFNCFEYLEQSVLSAIDNVEVSEVLLIDDKSEDQSGMMAKSLAERYPGKVIYLEHADGKNHGAGESRNLGLTNAREKFIAFLDGDDYYLPNRFKKTKEIFNQHPEIDGVYEAVENIFETEEIKERFVAKRPNKYKMGKLQSHLFLYTLDKAIAPEDLFAALIGGENGFFHFNGLVLRKSAIEKAGFLRPYMKLAQDTEYFMRLALVCKLKPGNLKKPVAIRRVHEGNRIWNKKNNRHFQRRVFLSLLAWLHNDNFRKEIAELVAQKYVRFYSSTRLSFFHPRIRRVFDLLHLFYIRMKFFRIKL